MRPGNPIGAYDAFLLAPIEVTFETGTRHSRRDTERIRSHVERKIIADIDATGLPRVDEPGPCAARVQIALLDIELHNPAPSTSSSRQIVSSWGAVTLVQNIFDSETGAPLMRFRVRRTMRGSLHGGGRDWGLIEETLGKLIEDTQSALVDAIPATDTAPRKAGCNGGVYRARTAGQEDA